MLIADFLSRVPKINDLSPVDDQFLDEHLFAVTVKTPWYANVVNYLAAGRFPAHLSPRERKLIIQCNTHFSWIGGYVFHTGSDFQIYRCIREDEIYDVPAMTSLVVDIFLIVELDIMFSIGAIIGL